MKIIHMIWYSYDPYLCIKAWSQTKSKLNLWDLLFLVDWGWGGCMGPDQPGSYPQIRIKDQIKSQQRSDYQPWIYQRYNGKILF